MWSFCYLLLSVNNLTSVINYCYWLKMMKKDPVRLYRYGYSIMPLIIKKDYKVLDALLCL